MYALPNKYIKEESSKTIVTVNWFSGREKLLLNKISIILFSNICQCHKLFKKSFFSGYRTRAKMEDDRITLIHAVEIYRTIYTAPWFQGKGQTVSESNICCEIVTAQ